MRAVLLEVSPEDLERRRKLGLDRWDEMWEGVLHMAPAPNVPHQRVQRDLGSFLSSLLCRQGRGELLNGVNVFNDSSVESDYRIPDHSFVRSGRESLIEENGIHGAPDAVIEIRSPEDESYAKLPWFAALGVREAIIIQRDSKETEVYRLAGSQYFAVAPDKDGWVTSEVMRVRFRAVAGEKPQLAVEDLDEPEARCAI
ncbi:MAG: Uma2 family endonuclease [Planctomycetes bacterium]|nr:Uma2 family endonuclease [Planctomycetota bacterium]